MPADNSTPAPTGTGDVDLVFSAATQVNFAAHQNSIPFLRELSVRNSGAEEIADLTLDLEASPAFIAPKRWTIDRLLPGDEIKIPDRHIDLNGQFLLELVEAMVGEVSFTLKRGDWALVRKTASVRILARNEWGGCHSVPELIAAFAQPNDPAVDAILAKAAVILEAALPGATLDGYASGKRRVVWAAVAAIWSAIGARKLKYSVPPASFESAGQKIRTPSMIFEGGIATCLDTTMLFCSAIEQAGLRPVVVMMKGHAFAGVWLQPEHFSVTITEDVTAVRKRIALDELLVFETTLVTQTKPPLFATAVDQGKAKFSPDKEAEFIHIVDIQRARDQKIRPLSLLVRPPEPLPVSEKIDTAPVVEAPPELPDFTVGLKVSDLATLSPKDRLDAWQRRLLDLSARNPLLNHRANASSIKLLCHDPAALEDRIAGGAQIQIKPMPSSVGDRDPQIHQQQTGKDLEKQILESGFEKNEIYSPSPKADLDSTLVDLYRKAKADLEEGGANTLFVGIGFLIWKSENNGTKYRAPLLLAPVELKRRSVRTAPVLSSHDDETRFNPTLLEMLRQDFDIQIPELGGGLPHDDNGIDVKGVFNIVRSHVKEIEGFDVVEDVILGTFSFAKYLMWKDLVDRTDTLRSSAVVAHLLDAPRDPFAASGNFSDPGELDKIKTPKDLYAPLDYDSSQLSAIVASAEQRDFVLIGPPGTGKSQSIANMIAHNLALGRKVLFVAEKRAALDVVYRRLDTLGLSAFCLELHSNKAKKRDVLNQLNRAWETAESSSQSEWEQEAERLRVVRDKLNAYVALLHKEHPNGLSIHRAIGIHVAYPNTPNIDFKFENPDMHDKGAFARLMASAHRMDVEVKGLGDIVGHPLSGIRNGDWSIAWQIQTLGQARSLLVAVSGARQALLAALDQLRITSDKIDFARLNTLYALATNLISGARFRIAWCLRADGASLIDDLTEACELLDRYRETEKRLSVSYAPEAWRTLDIASLRADLQIAETTWWPRSFIVRRRVIETLRANGGAKATPNPGTDLPLLKPLADYGAKLDVLSARMSKIQLWQGFGSDIASIRNAVAIAQKLRAALLGLITDGSDREKTSVRILELLEGGIDTLGPETAVGRSLAAFTTAMSVLNKTMEIFSRAIGADLGTAAPVGDDFLRLLEAKASSVIENEGKINQWCAWLRARDEAIGLGLAPMVMAIEQGQVPVGQIKKAFEAAYCRWWASRQIDSEEPLRLFSVNEHEDQRASFKKLDDAVQKLTVQHIRARLCAGIPHKDQVKDKPHFALLHREIQKQMRHIPIRRLFSEASEILPVLAPCVLMSPLSVAQYLPPELKTFDIVIFDEASQIAVWDAIGAIARGRQAAVAGDPNQMPPTNFFARGSAPADDDSDVDEDLESILDEMLAAGIPRRTLTWHYRSQSEGLIAFSNSKYYDGGLITFPAPDTQDRSVHLKFIEDGVYLRGKDQTNHREAEAIASHVVALLQDPKFLKEKNSIGIVTFNAKQQTLIENKLDAARGSNPGIEAYFSDDAVEAIFVKNLETVQGDERDVILFSVTFGKDEAGAMTMNFGPLNKDGGWRRLNVAITRARKEMVVFSSIKAEHIDLSRTQAAGAQGLKEFLDFADRGVAALGTGAGRPRGDYDSPFESSVAKALRQRGWEVHSQIGVGPFRIDLGIVHPETKGRYLAGVECDGATYHRSATARDRDLVREGVLRRLGWNILRIWSTDYWVSPASSIDRIHEKLLARKMEYSSSAERGNDAPSIKDAPAAEGDGSEHADGEDGGNGDSPAQKQETQNEIVRVPPAGASASQRATSGARHEELIESAKLELAPSYGLYRATQPSDLRTAAVAEQFYEDSYDPTLKSIITDVLRIEAPIHEDALVNRISRLHGFMRSGAQIARRVGKLARKIAGTSKEAVGTFFWIGKDDSGNFHMARKPATDEDRRSIDEISQQEIAAFLRFHAREDDPALLVARDLGILRLSTEGRRRIETIFKNNVVSTPR
jgi:very-short-patch-repair endonuclease